MISKGTDPFSEAYQSTFGINILLTLKTNALVQMQNCTERGTNKS
jgi:hypothetical protein